MKEKYKWKEISKKLSYLLRHNPKDLLMDKKGRIDVKDIIKKLNINLEDLKYIVENDDKQRFSFDENIEKIKANQGHTLKNLDLEFKESYPPEYLYHGTTLNNIDRIKECGIKKMKRHHVHLSVDKETALNVANRYCKNNRTPIIIKIDTKKMINDGIIFYVSENNIWLVDHINYKYIIEE